MSSIKLVTGKGNIYATKKKKIRRMYTYLEPCPKCTKNLIVRKAKDGYRFIGCTSYPNCTFTAPEKPL